MKFVAGDRVSHFTVGEGVVTKNEGGTVYVTFDGTNKRGKNFVGIYDPNWFRIHPNGLTKLPRPTGKKEGV